MHSDRAPWRPSPLAPPPPPKKAGEAQFFSVCMGPERCGDSKSRSQEVAETVLEPKWRGQRPCPHQRTAGRVNAGRGPPNSKRKVLPLVGKGWGSAIRLNQVQILPCQPHAVCPPLPGLRASRRLNGKSCMSFTGRS